MRRHPQSSAPCFRSRIARPAAFPNRFPPGFLPGFRAVAAPFIPLDAAGFRIEVRAWTASPDARWLIDVRLPAEPLALLGKRDRSGTESIRWRIDDFRPDILHLMRTRSSFNGLAAAKGR